jgi:hypothetical protein
MRDSSKSDYMDETLAGLARTAMALNISRVRSECICEDHEVIGVLRNQMGFSRGISPLAIVAWMAESDTQRRPSMGLDFKDR